MTERLPDAADARPGPRPRRWRRWSGRVILLLLIVYLLLVGLCGMNMSAPADYLMNLGSVAVEPELRAPDDGRVRLVVLQHGLWRSAGSLWKLERALFHHGYEVLNFDYPSTAGRIEDFAQLLRDRLEAYCAELPRPVDEVYYVGHSMGGLVIESYLSRVDARPPAACVFIGTPHRGAMLADLRKHWWLFQIVMGTGAAMQLSPGDPFQEREIALACPVGTIVGGTGDSAGFHESIPGDDDGTVAVTEARLQGESDSVRIPVGHTRLSFDDRTLRHVLTFLRHGRFSD